MVYPFIPLKGGAPHEYRNSLLTFYTRASKTYNRSKSEEVYEGHKAKEDAYAKRASMTKLALKIGINSRFFLPNRLVTTFVIICYISFTLLLLLVFINFSNESSILPLLH